MKWQIFLKACTIVNILFPGTQNKNILEVFEYIERINFMRFKNCFSARGHSWNGEFSWTIYLTFWEKAHRNEILSKFNNFYFSSCTEHFIKHLQQFCALFTLEQSCFPPSTLSHGTTSAKGLLSGWRVSQWNNDSANHLSLH